MQANLDYKYGFFNTRFKTPIPAAKSSEGTEVFAFAGVEHWDC